MNQNMQVLKYMEEFGPITPNKARIEFGVERLAAVIHRLREQGHWIATVDRRSYNGRQYAEYHLLPAKEGSFIAREDFAVAAAKGPIRMIG